MYFGIVKCVAGDFGHLTERILLSVWAASSILIPFDSTDQMTSREAGAGYRPVESTPRLARRRCQRVNDDGRSGRNDTRLSLVRPMRQHGRSASAHLSAGWNRWWRCPMCLTPNSQDREFCSHCGQHVAQ